MSLPDVVSRDEWLSARKELLAEEKALTRARDALNAKRRELPMVRIDKQYVFDGPRGEVGLLDLFEGRRQLIVQHFMFDPSWDDGCPSCTAGADEMSDGLLEHLARPRHDVRVVSRAPLAKIEDYKATQGWTFPWYSSFGTRLQLRLPRHDRRVGRAGRVQLPHEGRARGARPRTGSAERLVEQPGHELLPARRRRVFHTYSTFARGAE